jgi:hypothetical protein
MKKTRSRKSRATVPLKRVQGLPVDVDTAWNKPITGQPVDSGTSKWTNQRSTLRVH